MGNARKAALTALEKCRRADAWSDAVLGSVLDAEHLQGRDRGLAAALCYGVLQNRMLLDYVIEMASSVPMRKIEPKVLDLLRLSAYQLLFMDRIPASAAVNEGVSLCRSCGAARAAGFTNAVLRKIASAPAAFPTGTDAEALSLRYSHPQWLVEEYIARIGAVETEALLRCQNGETPVTLQVNTLRARTETLCDELTGCGLDAELHPFAPDCILLRHSGELSALDAFRRGDVYVQDAAAKLSVLAAAPKAGMRILDACAAPGGKSFAAAILSGGAEILSCDLHENKLKRIREGAERLGLHGIKTAVMDGRAFHEEYEGKFDLVIADVPCSGLGVIRKKPDIRYKDPDGFAALPEIQLAILRNVSRYLAPGGTLLYSTCTVRHQENEAVAETFLAENSAFAAESFELPGIGACPSGMLQLWPQRHGTDGFFFAKMRKLK